MFTLALGSGVDWRIRFGMCFIPVIVYTLLILPKKFPTNERVAAGVSYREMLAQVGGIGPAFRPTGDVRSDMEAVRRFYADKRGLYPESFGPVRLREETDAR